jgi:hypothetical protein
MYTYHLDLEYHTGLVRAFSAILHCDGAICGRTHETHLDPTTNVVLVWFPELLWKDPALVTAENFLCRLHLRQLQNGRVEHVQRGDEGYLIGGVFILPSSDVPHRSWTRGAFAETEHAVIPQIHGPCAD